MSTNTAHNTMFTQFVAAGGRKQACETCRQRKRRCDGRMPACSTCRKARTRCIYALKSSHSGLGVSFQTAPPQLTPPYDVNELNFAHPTATNPFDADLRSFDFPTVTQSPQGYTAVAESHMFMTSPQRTSDIIPRVTHDELDWLQTSLESVSSHDQLPDIDFTTRSTNHHTTSPLQSPPSVTSDYDIHVDHEPTSSTPHTHTPPTTTTTSPQQDQQYHLCPLPSHQQALKLVNLFFSAQHQLLPVVHKRTFMDKLEKDLSLVSGLPLFWIMIAMASSCDQSLEMQTRSHQWLGVASAKLDAMITSPMEIDVTNMLQASVWMIFESYARGDLTGAWLLLGRMCQLASALGFNRIDCKTGSTKRPRDDLLDECGAIEMEERRKAMWCLFLLDRIMASTKGLPLALDERQFLVNFPLMDDDFQQAQDSVEHLESQRETFSIVAFDLLNFNATSMMSAKPSFNHVLKASIIMGRTTVIQNGLHPNPCERLLEDEVQLLHTILQTFCAATAQPSKYIQTTTLMRLWLVLMLQCSRILMLHPAGSGTRGLCECQSGESSSSPSNNTSRRSTITHTSNPECWEAAEIVVRTFKQALDKSPESLRNPFLLPIVCACVRILARQQRLPHRSEGATSMIREVLHTVDRIGNKFPGSAGKCRDAIVRRLEENEDSTATAANSRKNVFCYVNFDCT